MVLMFDDFVAFDDKYFTAAGRSACLIFAGMMKNMMPLLRATCKMFFWCF